MSENSASKTGLSLFRLSDACKRICCGAVSLKNGFYKSFSLSNARSGFAIRARQRAERIAIDIRTAIVFLNTNIAVAKVVRNTRF